MPAVSAGGLGGGVIAREPEVGMLHGAGIEYFWKLKHIFLEITRNHSNNVDFALLGRAILTSVRYSHSHLSATRHLPVDALSTTSVDSHYNSLFSPPEQCVITTGCSHYRVGLFPLPLANRHSHLRELGAATNGHCSLYKVHRFSLPIKPRQMTQIILISPHYQCLFSLP